MGRRSRIGLSSFAAGAVIIAGVGIAAFLTSLSGAFVLDDHEHILENPRIRSLSPIGDLLAGSRPVVNLTLAVNYALGGLDPRGYHLVNLAIHLLAALVLYAILVRTLRGKRLRDRHGPSSTWLGAAAALVWVAHPLQTQAVTYVIQRGESLAGLLYLLTLHAVIRGSSSPTRARGWYALAILWCALGMATKPVMVSAPLVVLLYDRVFLADSWRDPFARRGGLHAALLATWGIAAYLMAVEPNPTAGFGIPISSLAYASSQPGVILHYLRLSLWPSPLVFDYGWPIAAGARAVWMPAIAIAALIAATVWALFRRPPLGFLGAWFFLTLAPSSSFVPIKDLAFEHRMYLPLAAVIVLVILAGDEALRRWFPLPAAVRRRVTVALLVVVVGALAFATSRRNLDYRSEVSIWQDVVAKRPQNPRGSYALGAALVTAGEPARAIPYFVEALRLQPTNIIALYNLGLAEMGSGDFEKAATHFRGVIRVRPDLGRAHHNLGLALARLGRSREAIASYREALRLAPGDPTIRPDLGIAQALLEHLDQVVAEYDRASHQTPGLHRTRLERVSGDTGSSAQIVARTYAYLADGRRVGQLRVLVELSGPEARVRFETEGEIPLPFVERLYAAVGDVMTRSGAERVDSEPAPRAAGP